MCLCSAKSIDPQKQKRIFPKENWGLWGMQAPNCITSRLSSNLLSSTTLCLEMWKRRFFLFAKCPGIISSQSQMTELSKAAHSLALVQTLNIHLPHCSHIYTQMLEWKRFQGPIPIIYRNGMKLGLDQGSLLLAIEPVPPGSFLMVCSDGHSMRVC